MHPGAGGGGYRPPLLNGVDAGLQSWPGFRIWGFVLVGDADSRGRSSHGSGLDCVCVCEKDEENPSDMK